MRLARICMRMASVILPVVLVISSAHVAGVEGKDLVKEFDAMTKHFKSRFEDVVGKERKKMKTELDAYKQEKERMKPVTVNGDDIIRLNVGGVKMSTKRSTLRLINGSLLSTMFNGRWERKLQRDKESNVFFDFNPKHFGLVLNYLRAKKIERAQNRAALPKIPPEEGKNYNNLVVYLGLQDVLFLNMDSFNLRSTGVTIKDDGTVAVNAPNSNHKYVLGVNIYHEKVTRWRLKLESFQNNHWLFVGIVKADVVPSGDTSYNWSGVYGWALGSSRQVYTNGKVSYVNALQGACKEGDTVELVLDCSAARLTLLLPADKKFQLPLPTSLKWRLHINLYGANDKIRIMN